MGYYISIIVTVFNAENYVRDALNSIVSQTIGLENLEVIIVDDCSTDNSGRIIDEYANKYENFKAIYLSKNSGAAGKPRNVGMQNATGDYLMFLDSDDFYSDDACEILYNKIKKENVDIVFGKYIVFSRESEFELNYSFFGDINEIKISTIDDDLNLLTLAPSIITKIYKRSFIQENNLQFPEGILAEDLVFLLNAFLKANGIIFLNNRSLYYYRVRDVNGDESISNIRDKKHLMSLILGYQEAYNTLKISGKEEYFPFVFKSHLEFWINSFIKSNEKPSEKKEILKKIGFLFEKFKEYEINPEKKYLVSLFDYISSKDYDKAILIADVLNDVIKDRQILQKNYFKLDQDYATLKKRNNQLEQDYKNLDQDYITLKKRNNQLKKNNSVLSKQNVKFIDQIDIKKKQVAELQTISGWFNYKTKNIYYRLKKKLKSN